MEIKEYEQLVKSLNDPLITKIAYDSAIRDLSNRIRKVWKFICEKSNRYLDDEMFFAFPFSDNWKFVDNCVVFNDCSHVCCFYTDFDTGGGTENNPYYLYNSSFPVELLWDLDWQNTIISHVESAIQKLTDDRKVKLAKKAANKLARKERDKKFREQEKKLVPVIKDKIKSCLTAEEMEVFLRVWRSY